MLPGTACFNNMSKVHINVVSQLTTQRYLIQAEFTTLFHWWHRAVPARRYPIPYPWKYGKHVSLQHKEGKKATKSCCYMFTRFSEATGSFSVAFQELWVKLEINFLK